VIAVLLPLTTGRGLNDRLHWAQRARQTKSHRHLAFYLTPKHAVPCVVTLTRLSAGTLDDDNLRGALKGVRDGVADRLGIDDADPRVRWEYAQEKCKRGESAVRVEIEERRR
jgi:hypothetical protein